MCKWLVLLTLAVTGVALVPDAGEARGWRRRCCYPAPWFQPCCPPPWYCPPPGPPIVYYPYGLPPAPPGSACAPLLPARTVPTPAAPLRAVRIKGRIHQIYDTRDRGQVVEEVKPARTEFALNAGSQIPDTDVFLPNHARRIAKTTILDVNVEPFDSISALRATLQSDDDMKNLGIGKGPTVNRVAEEKRNVQVKAFIYAFRKEDDNDYHVILGDPPGTPNAQYLNAEISGIPITGTDAIRNTLWTVRGAFKQTFQLGDEGPVSYFRPDPPVPVRIRGSLFWDVEHPPPHTVGPQDFSPGTAWEIHPISQIEFLGSE